MTFLTKKNMNIKTILISTLFFYNNQDNAKFIENLVDQVISLAAKLDTIKFSIVLRNNAPDEDDDCLIDKIRDYQLDLPATVSLHYIHTGFNVGFGTGHNLNEESTPSDLIFVLNNDIRFPNLNFIADAIELFESDPKIAIVGPLGAPGRFRPETVSVLPKSFPNEMVDYAEASITLYRTSSFREVHGFSKRYAYAYYEDSDLSLKLYEKGYTSRCIEMPHQHFRSSSASRLPDAAILALSEGNRAKFSSRWNSYLEKRLPPGHGVIDLRADGFGDMVYALRPVFEFLKQTTCPQITILMKGLRSAFLYDRFSARIVDSTSLDIVSSANLRQSATSFWLDCTKINHSAPFQSQDLIYSALGVELDKAHDTDFSEYLDQIKTGLRNWQVNDVIDGLGKYIVVHCDSQRTNFEGRGVPIEISAAVLKELAKDHRIVLIGQKQLDDLDEIEIKKMIDGEQIRDFRNSSLAELTGVIAWSEGYFGIDSGPMHVAQLFNIPSVVVFGSTAAGSKVINRNNTQPISHRELSCLGCYHTHVSPGYAYCMRRDQACVRKLDPSETASKAAAFFKTREPDWSESDQVMRKLQTEWLTVLQHHPMMKTPLVVSPEGGMHQISQDIIALVDRVHSRLEQESISIAKKSEQKVIELLKHNRTLKSENDKLITHARNEQIKALSATIMPDKFVKPDLQLRKIDLLDSEANDIIPKRCEVSFDDKDILINAIEPDPQLLFSVSYPIPMETVEEVYLNVELTVDRQEVLQIFYAANECKFTNSGCVSASLKKGANSLILNLPADVRIDYLRLDPSKGPSITKLSTVEVVFLIKPDDKTSSHLLA